MELSPVYVVVQFFTFGSSFYKPAKFFQTSLVFVYRFFISCLKKVLFILIWGCSRKIGKFLPHIPLTIPPTNFYLRPINGPPLHTTRCPLFILHYLHFHTFLFSSSSFSLIQYKLRIELLTSGSVWISSPTSSPNDHASNRCQCANFSRYHWLLVSD